MTISGHGSAAKSIVDELRNEIISGHLQSGERLGEMALAERFSVSRGPIREALRSLADAGLVSFAPNVGARVRRMTIEDARALYEVRAALESEAARLAASRASKDDARQLIDLLVNQEPVVRAHPHGAYLQGGGDTDFHAVISRLSDNRLITRLLFEELYPQLLLLRQQHQNVRGRGVEALHEHERIAEAISQGEPELAGMLMRRHIRESWTSLERQMASEGEG
ncbi:GntR family transcriptional regulator [Pelagibacterium luteolum]|uniref:DNA-binding transcriptional regulator, GntR family n=1 Tax=Pelagibacterium luteolum TaxID=440168 RepID=A0A1G7XUS6_9HYPH|nr:GntR family transcriptional regulator [Pelagibacterium luteolum]SDG87958.1 DNA-binding transcriptional regulator, GntR family [Pelagibacterium luteolum]